MIATVRRARGLQGEVRLPGDKSISHRALMFGAIASGTSRVRGLLVGADVRSTARCLRDLGVEIEGDSVVGKGLRAQRLPVRAGRETMLGKTVPALARIDAISGKVSVEGEYWNAVSDAPVEPGQRVEIIAIDGLTLKVKPKQT